VLDEVVDFGDQVFDAPETTSANRLLGDETEPTFDLIEPGRVGGRLELIQCTSAVILAALEPPAKEAAEEAETDTVLAEVG
jgi:hypothetical protein